MKYFEAHPVTDFKDANGDVPEILIVDGNRTGGKTTAFSRFLVDEFLNHGKKFFIIKRYKNELKDIADAFFSDIRSLFFEDHVMTSKSHADGAYIELFLDKKSCGYASALTMTGKLKLYSHIFADVENMFFDEYQDEYNVYLPDELKRFHSLHTTIARGHGKAVRFVPVYMASNSISIFNPYYRTFGITSKINSSTKVYRGDGFVLLRLTIKDVALEQRKSAFNRAMNGSGYLDSAVDNAFLNDDSFNVGKRTDVKKMLFGFIDGKDFYSVNYSGSQYYVRKGGDRQFPNVFGVHRSDRSGNITAAPESYLSRLRFMYENANVFFETQESKHAFLELIS